MTEHPNIPIHIVPHHLPLSPALSRFVREKLAGLARVTPGIVGVDVTLRLRHGTTGGKYFTASARVGLPGRDVHASASHADLYAAIITLENCLRRRLRKRKTKSARHINENRPADGRTSAAHLEAILLKS